MQPKLEKLFNFNERDLTYNRQGRMSPRQRRRMIWYSLKAGFWLLLSLTLAPYLLITGSNNIADRIASLFLGFVLMVFWYVLGENWLSTVRNLRAGEVIMLETKISLSRAGGFRKSSEYRVHVRPKRKKKHQFQVTYKQWDGLETGAKYRIYHTRYFPLMPRVHDEILAIELLD